MNKKQAIALWIGIIIIILMGLYPPWVCHDIRKVVYGKYSLTTEPGSYSFIANPPQRAKFIDLYRLGVQWAMVAAITGALIFTFKDKKTNNEKKTVSNLREATVFQNMNWKRGLRRITLCFATLSATAGFICAENIAHRFMTDKIENAQSHLQNVENSEYGGVERLSAISDVVAAKKIDFKKMSDEAIAKWPAKNEAEIKKQMKSNKQQKIAEAENNFWLKMPAWGLIGFDILAGVAGGAFVFFCIFEIYRFLQWLVFGFLPDKPKDEQSNK